MTIEKRGTDLIAAERERQVNEEGWTPKHDDQHVHGELADAAICYAGTRGRAGPQPVGHWPWEEGWWKPSGDRVCDLTKAGALIAAEIDRLQREASRTGGDGDG